MHIPIEPPSMKSPVSTSVDPPSTSTSSTIQYDSYVNLIPQVDALDNATASCSYTSSHLPISQLDEDTMEAMSTPDYPYT